jgi:hypothetical protein
MIHVLGEIRRTHSSSFLSFYKQIHGIQRACQSARSSVNIQTPDGFWGGLCIAGRRRGSHFPERNAQITIVSRHRDRRDSPSISARRSAYVSSRPKSRHARQMLSPPSSCRRQPSTFSSSLISNLPHLLPIPLPQRCTPRSAVPRPQRDVSTPPHSACHQWQSAMHF